MRWIDALGFVGGLVANVFRRPATEPFPFGAAATPPAYRGRVRIDAGACVGCSTCAHVCASQAIHLEEESDGIRLLVWHARCTFCGLCAHYCPTHALRLTNEWDLAHANADKYSLAEDVLAKYRTCSDCGMRLMVPRGDVFVAAAVGLDRHGQAHEPRCDACRRKSSARQILETRL
jgi:formate hydrogenlyase subunit 6/NADH:ubiquinone oxidoreductase subunit I